VEHAREAYDRAPALDPTASEAAENRVRLTAFPGAEPTVVEPIAVAPPAPAESRAREAPAESR
jgi:hypothetical protein